MHDSDWTPSIVPKDDNQTATSTPSPKQTDLQAAMAARLEEANARAHELYKLAREDKQPSKLPHDATQKPSDDPQIPVHTFRPTVPGGRPSLFGSRVVRGITGFLLIACVGVAAIAWKSYGDAVKEMIVGLQFASQPAKVAPKTPALPPELADLLQTMARDLATLDQRIEQLKTSQEQMVRDNTAVAEQLKAALAQMTRDNAAVVDQLTAIQISLLTPRTRREHR